MTKKKYFVLFVLMLLVLVVSGCPNQDTPTPDKPYITNINPDKTYGVDGEKINILVSVMNPTKVNFNGHILIQTDIPSCFGMSFVNFGTKKGEGYITNISVSATTTNSALLTMNIPSSNQAKCYQPANHQLKIFVLQNEEVLDFEIIDFSLFQKK